MDHYKKVDMADPNIREKNDLESKCKDLDTLTSRRIQEQHDYEESAYIKKKELDQALVEQKEIEIKKEALTNSKTLLEKDIVKIQTSLTTQKTTLKT